MLLVRALSFHRISPPISIVARDGASSRSLLASKKAASSEEAGKRANFDGIYRPTPLTTRSRLQSRLFSNKRESCAWSDLAAARRRVNVNHSCFFHTSVVANSQGQKVNSSEKEEERRRSLTNGEKILRFVGWLGGFYSRKAVLTRSALAFYENSIDTVNYEAFFKVCNLPDTLQSWFLIAHLHVWLCMVRLKREGRDGDYMLKRVVSTFWFDVEQRIKVLGVHSGRVVNKSLQELVPEFYGLTIAFEEGLLSDDRILAAAIWRNLIYDKENTDPSQLARVVDYIRSQVQHMDSLDTKWLLRTGKIELLPFSAPESSVQ